MYDWANSVYPLVITSTIFPIYFNAVAKEAAVGHEAVTGRPIVEFFGMEVLGSSLLLYAISVGFLIVAAISPLLTALADFSGRKKRFMQVFCYLGAASCCGLFFFTKETLEVAVLLFILATVGFAGSIVFYNSYLPDIATEDKLDSLSAKGFSLGYVGSVILLVLSLGLVLGGEKIGVSAGLASRLAFLLTGLWWGGFALLPFARLPADPGRPADAQAATGGWLFNGFRELANVWRSLAELPLLKQFLLAYFFYNMGVQTVMYVATPFAEETLGMKSGELIATILILQVVAIGGAYLFARLSERVGNTRALSVAVIIWAAICVAGYYVQAGATFYALAAVIGFTMGGVQSLSRSTYAKLIPENTPDTASYFSFFDVTEKLSIVLGTASFSLISQLTGSMRNSILALIVFFILGLAFLFTLRGKALRPVPRAGHNDLAPDLAPH